MTEPFCEECRKLTSDRCARHSVTVTYYGQGQSPHCCPVCGGRGWVMPGFYNPWGLLGSNVADETCRTCSGSGVLWR